MSSTSIERRVDTGHLLRVAPGLYRLAALVTPDTQLWLALLGVPASVLSRQTAARLHGMAVPADDQIHLTAEKGIGRTMVGVVVHESRLLRPEDLVRVGALPATSAERTLVDLAGGYSVARLRFLVDRHYAGSSPAPFVRCVRELLRPGLPGGRKLRRLLGELDVACLSASELERRIWLGLNRAGCTGFAPQFTPPWFDGSRGVVDFGHAELRTIIEGDGRRWHDTQQAMADDRRRDRLAAEHDWLVIRLTWHEVVDHPETTFDHVRQILANRRRTSLAA